MLDANARHAFETEAPRCLEARRTIKDKTVPSNQDRRAEAERGNRIGDPVAHAQVEACGLRSQASSTCRGAHAPTRGAVRDRCAAAAGPLRLRPDRPYPADDGDFSPLRCSTKEDVGDNGAKRGCAFTSMLLFSG